VLLASAPTVPALQAASPVQQATITQGIWAGLAAAGRYKGAHEVEEEEQPGAGVGAGVWVDAGRYVNVQGCERVHAYIRFKSAQPSCV